MNPRKVAGAGLRLLALAALSCGTAAWAHNPIAECKAVDEKTIECVGGFSDGSDAPGVTLDVVSYDEKVLLPGKLGNNSKLRFTRPDDDFYVLFDAGPGHVVEIDQTEIEETY